MDHAQTALRRPTGQTLGAGLAHLVEQKIQSHGWKSGHLIGSEAELCEQFGVGTASVREAVRILEARGIARARRGPGGGLFVTTPEQGTVTDAARRFLADSAVSRSDLFEVWLALEQLAVSKLASTIDHVGAKQLRESLAKERTHTPDSWNILPNIHLEIARQSGNAALELFIRVLCQLSLHSYGQHVDPRHALPWLYAQHVEIVEAIIAGDAALALLHLRRFIDAVKREDFGLPTTSEGDD